jgi:uncharacterized protein (TIGR02391 family)
MARNLLQIVRSLEDLLSLSQDELAWALLEDMQARLANPLLGNALRDSLSNSLLSVATLHSNPMNTRDLARKLDKAGRDAFALLEKWNLVEPDEGINGRNGYMVLTDEGKAATERTDFQRVRIRGWLHEEMLHPLLRGRIYGYFSSDDLKTAVLEAFITIEVEVRGAGGYTPKDFSTDLMHKAFALGGPLTKPTDSKSDCNALGGLFAGAMSRFRNPSAHSHRTYQDVLEAMEELMLASRLLRIVDERRP